MGLPFEFKFIDDDYPALYASEERRQVLVNLFCRSSNYNFLPWIIWSGVLTAQKGRKEIGTNSIRCYGASNVKTEITILAPLNFCSEAKVACLSASQRLQIIL